jgi:hypothetical protein
MGTQKVKEEESYLVDTWENSFYSWFMRTRNLIFVRFSEKSVELGSNVFFQYFA